MLAILPAQAHIRTLEGSARISPSVTRWLATADTDDQLTILVSFRDDGSQLQADQGATYTNRLAHRAHVHQVLHSRAERNARYCRL